MKTYILSEVDAVRANGALFGALKAIRDVLNDLSGRSVAGTGTLVSGVVAVTVPGLQAGTTIVPGYVRPTGTTGTLSCDPAEYDISRGTAVIRSSSSADANPVSWVAVT